MQIFGPVFRLWVTNVFKKSKLDVCMNDEHFLEMPDVSLFKTFASYAHQKFFTVVFCKFRQTYIYSKSSAYFGGTGLPD